MKIEVLFVLSDKPKPQHALTVSQNPGLTSLRATVPEGIAVFLGLNEGDTLEWRMEDTPEGRIATVRKAK